MFTGRTDRPPLDAWRRAAWSAGLALLLLAAYTQFDFIVRIHNFTVDDAYITARYARNLAEGYGPRFNPAEPPVEGTSNFLYMLLLSGLFKLGVPFPLSAKLLGVAFLIGCLIASALLVKRCGLSGPFALAAGALLIADPRMLLWTFGGLETTCYVFLILVAFLLFASVSSAQPDAPKVPVSLGVVCALVAMTRTEGVLLAAAFFATLIAIRSRRRHMLLFVLSFSVVFGCWFLWKYTYYGDLMPNSGLAKSAFQVDLNDISGTVDRAITGRQWTSWRGFWVGVWPLALVSTGIAVRAVVDVFHGRAAPISQSAVLLAAALFIGASSLVYLKIWDWMPGERYYVPLTALLAVLAVIGAGELVGLLSSRIAQALVLIGLSGLVYFGSVRLSLAFQEPLARNATEYAKGLEGTHRGVADWINAHTAPQATIALLDVGLIPFVTERSTLDTGGLNDRRVRQLLTTGTPALWAADLVARDVDVFVLVSPSRRRAIEALIRAAPSFHDKYVHAYHQPASGAGGYGLDVFAKPSVCLAGVKANLP